MTGARARPHSKCVALATYVAVPALSDDDQLLPPALGDRGIVGVPAVWNDGSVDWTVFDAVVLRSCWDYYRTPEAFLEWIATLERLGVAIWNPPHVARWNVEKSYLHALAAAGVRVVPTRWVDAGSDVTLGQILREEGWADVVVKPAVSNNARDTWRTRLDSVSEDEDRFREVVGRTRALVQPFVEAIATEGEWSLVFIDGRYSHAVIKKPRAGDFRVQSDHGGSSEIAEPPGPVREAATRALSAAPGPTIYARVDGCVIDGALHLMELELLEPSLFLSAHPEAPGRLAEAIARRLG